MKTKMNAFGRWLNTFLDEKGIDREEAFEVPGASGPNHIPVGCLVEAMLAAPKHEQDGIKKMLVRIDFANAPVRPYLAHLAKAIAV